MKRILPTSLLGQVTLVLALGLLVVQTLSVIALYRASEQRRDASLVNSIAFRLIAETAGRGSPAARRLRAAERARRATLTPSQQRQLDRMAEDALPFQPRSANDPTLGEIRRGGGLPFSRLMRLSLQRSDTAPVTADADRIKRFEDALAELLGAQEIETGEIRIVRRRAGEDAYVSQIISNLIQPPFRRWSERRLLVAAIEQPGGTGWLTVRIPEPSRESGGLALIIAQTLSIFTVLMVLLFLVLRRLTRPLARLTDRVEDFSRMPGQASKLDETGPSDTRRLIAAYNRMEARIAALLDEKDVMLGAIGHDLKTPLAALRVRVESVPDDGQRARMAASIEDITRTLDDILSLARVGRAHEQAMSAGPVDIRALAESVVEEFEDLGEPVEIAEPSRAGGRLVAKVQETWLKRALRNLISNAVRYGEAARVTILEESASGGQWITLTVDDSGPGIPEHRIADMLEPFTRGEASRNRATGGAGLGLTLARAIAEAHRGELILSNRPEGGLSAQIRLPA